MRKELYVITWVVSIMCLGIVMVSCGGQEPVPPVKPVSFTGKRVLWLGTSIPEGCSYPKAACEKLGMHCVNQALGSSFLAIRTATAPSRYDLLSLTMSEEEKKAAYGDYVERGIITLSDYARALKSGYDHRVLPYVEEVDVIVIDHGYNDDFALKEEYDKERVDWESEDRTSFFGAFNFLYRIIRERNPNVVVLVGGYFQNTCTIGYFVRGTYVSRAWERIAEHYGLPLLDAWNRVGLSDGYMPHSAGYLDELNRKYGKNFTKVHPNSDGDITWFQAFCPDGVHPFSDPTGGADTRLDSVFISLLQERLSPFFQSSPL